MASGKGYGEESSWFCSDPWSRENGCHSLSMSSHRQIRDKLKGHLQVVKAQGQDERVNPDNKFKKDFKSGPLWGKKKPHPLVEQALSFAV